MTLSHILVTQVASRGKGSWKIKSWFKIVVRPVTKLRAVGLWKQVRKERMTASNWGLIRHVGKDGRTIYDSLHLWSSQPGPRNT